MVDAHRYLAYAVIAGCLFAGIFGLVAYRRGRSSAVPQSTCSRCRRRCSIAQAALGLLLLSGDYRATDELHYVYGGRRARRRALAVVLRARRPTPSAALVRRLRARRRGPRRSWHHDRVMRRFFENRTVRGLAIVALIALVVVVLSLEPVLAVDRRASRGSRSSSRSRSSSSSSGGSGAATSRHGRIARGACSTPPSRSRSSTSAPRSASRRWAAMRSRSSSCSGCCAWAIVRTWRTEHTYA